MTQKLPPDPHRRPTGDDDELAAARTNAREVLRGRTATVWCKRRGEDALPLRMATDIGGGA